MSIAGPTCAAGEYISSLKPLACLTCNAGEYSYAGAWVCCGANEYAPYGSSLCLNCPDDTYSNMGASECIGTTQTDKTAKNKAKSDLGVAIGLPIPLILFVLFLGFQLYSRYKSNPSYRYF
jgi:hypothetical protein